ncbi:MAG TPA: outer membrane protein assembly factor BamA, partial [Methylomirabilota bacterium]
MTGRLVAAALLAAATTLGPGPVWASPAPPPVPPRVVDADVVSPHRLDTPLPAEIVGTLRGTPRWRGAVRDVVERLWALGLFETVRVEEEPVAPEGVRLRFHVVRRPWAGSVEFRGERGLPDVELAAAAGLALGGDASPARLEQARRAVLERLRREGYFGAGVEAESTPDPATNGRDVAFVVASGERARVGQVELRGLARAHPGLAHEAFGVETGDRFRESAVREGAAELERRLREEGFVEARVEVASITWSPADNRVHVVAAVTEGPHLRVELQGNEVIGDAALRERLTFGLAGVVDEPELRSSVRRIEAAYRERGHALATAGATLERRDDEVLVRIAVVEGPRVTVESVTFTGLTRVPEAQLRQRMETAPPGVLRRRVFQEEVLQRDLRALTAFLVSEGHAEARVGPPEVAYSEDRTRVRVVVPVEEGPRLRIGAVRLAGVRALAEPELRAALALAPGGPWSEHALDQARRVLERRYARAGYLAARVETASERRDGEVDVVVTVSEGPRTRVGRVLVRGLTRTKPHVVLRELPLAAGDPFDPDALVEAQRKLALLGLFESVEVEPLRPAPVPFADVTVTVREGKPWHLAGGVGYSTFEGGRGFAEVGHDNLFGTGRSLALRFRLSERADRADLLYREPWLLGTRWQGEGDLFYERREEIGFDLERRGLALGAQRELWPERIRGLRGAVRYEISQVDRFDIDSTLVAEDIRPGRELLSTVTPELTLDRRDQPLDPRSGSFHLASLEVGGFVLGGDADFLKTRLETAWFLDWLRPTVLALGLRLGLATPFGDTADLPIEKRFFAGGATTVRGYRERRLGPLDAKGNPLGGNALVVLNVEWRFPLWRWLDGAIFVDSGAVTARVADLSIDELRSGVGAGVRLRTPVGPLR